MTGLMFGDPVNTVTCVTCGKAFEPSPSHHDGRVRTRYCSRRCYWNRDATSLVDRFWSHVAKGAGCWEWTAARTLGYGVFGIDPHTMRKAHRVAWELTNGPIPDGLNVCHSCDNPPCVRPDHLFLGTQADNLADMTTKGRRVSVVRSGEANPNAKLTATQVRAIRTSAGEGERYPSLAHRFGVSASLIHLIVRKKIWAAT